jgi:hypothetical protein
MGKGIAATFNHLSEFRLGQFRRSYDGVPDTAGPNLVYELGFEYWDALHFPARGPIVDYGDRAQAKVWLAIEFTQHRERHGSTPE